MAYTLKDRVLESSVSTGTGDFVLDGALTGYQGFIAAGDGAQIPYTIQGKNPDGTLSGEWEVGIGTYHLGGNYLSRDSVLESSNSNAKVAFASGSKDVFLDLPGELVVQGPNSATASDFVAFDGTSGKIIKDSGYSSASFATAAQGAKADTAVQTSQVGVANGVASLDAGGKVPVSQIPALGDLNYQGTWNASTNTPTLTSSVGTKGYYYVVNVAGTTNLNGISDWAVGDWAVFNGSIWQKIDNTDAVTSVNGYTGTVVLTYTDVGAQPAGTYVTSVSGTAPVVSSGGTTPAISMHVADATHDGYLSSTDWSAFNSKVTMTYPPVGIPYSTGTAWGTSYTTTGTGTIVALQTNPTIYNPNIDVIDFDTAYATTLTAGQMGWDGNNTLGLGMIGGNVTQHIGEDQFFYCKATSTITKGQVVMFTGAVGASGVPTGAPATGITDGTYIMGIAAENIATNGFGLVQSFGTLRNVNTTGYADGDILWYDPTVTGGLTKTKPSAPNVKAQMAAVINGGSSGGGTILIRINPGSTLGGTDSNAQVSAEVNGQILTYDGAGGYWKNTTVVAGTAISVSSSANGVLTITNSAPDQTVVLTAGTGISITGTYPSFTITNSAPDQVVSLTGAGTTTVTGSYPNFTITSNDAYTGTVTSVTGTSPISVATGTTTPVVSMTQASGSTNGWLSSTDWTTFNSKGSGTVTSVSVVSANGFAGTVATATTTPAITLTTSITGMLKGNGTAISAGTAGTDYAVPTTSSTWSTSQRGTVTTDNDGSFDMSVTNNFKCTPTGTFALTFTNITAGQSGYVLLVNTSGYAVTAAATTKVNTTFLATVSTAGTYLISYFTDGTNVYVTTGGAMS